MRIEHGPVFSTVVVIPPFPNPFQARDSYDDVKTALETASMMSKGFEFVNKSGQRIFVPAWSLERILLMYEAQEVVQVPKEQAQSGIQVPPMFNP